MSAKEKKKKGGMTEQVNNVTKLSDDIRLTFIYI